MPIRQAPSIILPQIWSVGTEVETINDLVEHTSIEFSVENLREKQINVIATEVIVAGVPGPLWIWVETSPVPSTISTAYWSAIGGGGGAVAPVAPIIIAPTGVTLTTTPVTLSWTIHSVYARLVIQTPVAAFAATAPWTVQAVLTGQN